MNILEHITIGEWVAEDYRTASVFSILSKSGRIVSDPNGDRKSSRQG